MEKETTDWGERDKVKRPEWMDMNGRMYDWREGVNHTLVPVFVLSPKRRARADSRVA